MLVRHSTNIRQEDGHVLADITVRAFDALEYLGLAGLDRKYMQPLGKDITEACSRFGDSPFDIVESCASMSGNAFNAFQIAPVLIATLSI